MGWRWPAVVACNGPRGGGRDRDKVLDHVRGAEVAYARKLGVKHRQPARDDTEAIMAIRDAISAALQAASPEQSVGPTSWPPRYVRGPPHRLARPRPRLGDGRQEHTVNGQSTSRPPLVPGRGRSSDGLQNVRSTDFMNLMAAATWRLLNTYALQCV